MLTLLSCEIVHIGKKSSKHNFVVLKQNEEMILKENKKLAEI